MMKLLNQVRGLKITDPAIFGLWQHFLCCLYHKEIYIS